MMKAQAWARTLGAALVASVLTIAATEEARTAESPVQKDGANAVGASAAETSPGDGASGASPAAEVYTFAFYDLPLIAALDMLSARSGRRILLKGPAQDAPIDARFVAVRFDKALSEILRSRQHVILGAADGTIEIELLDAPAKADPASFEGQAPSAKELGLFPISDGVVVPEKPRAIGLKPGGLALDLAGDDSALGPSPNEKAPPNETPAAD